MENRRNANVSDVKNKSIEDSRPPEKYGMVECVGYVYFLFFGIASRGGIRLCITASFLVYRLVRQLTIVTRNGRNPANGDIVDTVRFERTSVCTFKERSVEGPCEFRAARI